MQTSEQKQKYATAMEEVCALLGLDITRVMRRADLPPDYLRQASRGPTPQQYFAVWNAICAESDRPDLALFLGRTYATGPFHPAIFAFSHSPDVKSGLLRLAVFKSLEGPCAFTVDANGKGVTITIALTMAGLTMPASLQTVEIVYILELIRHCTEAHIIPDVIHMPNVEEITPQEAAYFGVMPQRSQRLSLTLSVEDAARPLLPKAHDRVVSFQTDLMPAAVSSDVIRPTTIRVRAALVELLPAGLASVGDVSRHLHLSARTLQRQLAREETTFQAALDQTRCELALLYLRRGGVSVDEISYLLAYTTPSSFYRAFHGWTGMTPQQARQSAA